MLPRQIAHSIIAVVLLGTQATGQNPSDAQRIADLEKAVQALNARVSGVETSVTDFSAKTDAAHIAHVDAVSKANASHRTATTDALNALTLAIQERVPIGTVLAYAGPDPESLKSLGWYVCDGQEIPLTTQTESLFKVIGTSHGGRGTDPARPDSFCLPDYRSRFLRGVNPKDTEAELIGDKERQVPRPILDLKGNAGYAVGSLQRDSFQQHTHTDQGHPHDASISPNPHSHTYREHENGGGSPPAGNGGLTDKSTSATGLTVTVASGRAILGGATGFPSGAIEVRATEETRPVNIYVYFIIRVK